MPLSIPQNNSLCDILTSEGISLIDKSSFSKNIKSLKVLILNLMPAKLETEIQLLRVLGFSNNYIEVTFLTTKTYTSKNTSKEYLDMFYKTFDEIKDEPFDGMIITGAPVEHLDFEDIIYWDELKDIMDYSSKNIKSTFHICWGAQAGLYHHYGIKKYNLHKKIFGVFSHKSNNPYSKLLNGFDDEFFAPHSRYSYMKKNDFEGLDDLEILSESDEAGIYIVKSKNFKNIFVTGHSEYDSYTLYNEYKRDINKNIDTQIPKNYFLNDNPNNKPIVKWRGHSNLLFYNWIKILTSL
ncbi:homoserine O-succinyltransferase [Tepidibacter hydrothermalis]|uniref:Homoserine O-acetyltransferase n=1 Tax=Tepidibacter hydrothermalis TaxID=3036126 RepID=A0ABY8EEZ2_9FIRM|nr:homoserine O-succinyltransferase [Tepidibacter hydrothermalis]WFD11356.1 homoserine O-succinyltransferase [Tepidibacter hydrothermalis]